MGYLATKGTWPTRMCFTCGCPIAIFGWLTPCRHLYCLSCADFMKKANKCGRCALPVNKVESMDFDEDAAALISECPVSDCVQAFFDQPSLQSHLTSAHPRFVRPLAPVLPPPPKGEPRMDTRSKTETFLLHPITEKEGRQEHMPQSLNTVSKKPTNQEPHSDAVTPKMEPNVTGQKRPWDGEGSVTSSSESSQSTLTDSKPQSESLDAHRTEESDRTSTLSSEQGT